VGSTIYYESDHPQTILQNVSQCAKVSQRKIVAVESQMVLDVFYDLLRFANGPRLAETKILQDDEPGVRKVRAIWGCLSKAVERCKQVHELGISDDAVNVFQGMHLVPPNMRGMFTFGNLQARFRFYSMIIVFVSQCMLATALVWSSYDRINDWGSNTFCAVTGVLAGWICAANILSQMQASLAFWTFSPSFKWTIYGMLDLFVNIILAPIVVAITVILVGACQTLEELSLNFVAIVFVIELDDMCGDLTTSSQLPPILEIIAKDLQTELTRYNRIIGHRSFRPQFFQAQKILGLNIQSAMPTVLRKAFLLTNPSTPTADQCDKDMDKSNSQKSSIG
jgi:hypothetical protein